VLGTYLTHHTALHRADLVSNMYAGNPAFEQRFAGLVAAMRAQGMSIADAQRRAFALLDGTVMKQAAMLAYNDAWLFILGSFLAVIPAVFLLRRPSRRAAAPADVH
jgi:DHA2 family multidrug resistance protein